MSKLGRPKSPPIKLSEEQIELAIELASRGEPLKIIIRELCISEIQFWRFRQENLNFEASFASARQEGLEHIADALLTLADDEADVARARLKADNFKWLLSKRKPGTYGDRLDVNLNQTVDIKGALQEAKARTERLVVDTKLLLNAHPNSDNEDE